MKLPDEFCQRMKLLLGEAYADFLSSYASPRYYGLRVNTLKISGADFLKRCPFEIIPVPWTKNGFYFSEQDRPAKHPYYHAGLYYIQEPSAMAPAQVLRAEPGDRILDLCAAPGGKSTQIAADLQGRGVLVSNDISLERTRALTKNLELFGVVNAVILNETPEKLAAKFPGFFSKILLDAPCSGEGMFRKDPDAVRQWGVHSSAKCVLMQRDILFFAAQMLSPGGRMIYSTCTFNPEENEKMMEDFLQKQTDFDLVDICKEPGWEEGRADWAGGNSELKKTARLWPHRLKGEGHYVALLEKRGQAGHPHPDKKNGVDEKKLKDYYTFAEEHLAAAPTGNFVLYGDHLYLQPVEAPNLNGVKVIKPGLYLGVFKKNRFEPSHSLALALKKDAFRRTLDFSPDARELGTYLKGETLHTTGERGWVGVCVDGYPLGWGKQLEGVLKNHYPKGWRQME
ncbi:RsmF rRNA methyltransferase first C-terminal domain-containing protein [Candidatus Formimonas warabiya]|uniref:SAM-dependent methyltransferase n=1 Tax=Formimonas warabiya TaxID=1761012 RepID=A0A3G1KMK9_FORW1|nr:RsmF rRNA methyltransferase first C-terminal domain-containing protein [Candidatus Formimonas warabiya]ATW23669.1 SAM-dependent methyltransferase [Candidatus Formimonas warabiya]